MSEDQGGISGIMDGVADQIKKTSRIFAILIGLIIVPLAVAMIAILLIVVTVHHDLQTSAADEELQSLAGVFDIVTAVVIGFIALVAIVMGLGVMQLVSLNRWTKKYKKFQDKMADIDKKLD